MNVDQTAAEKNRPAAGLLLFSKGIAMGVGDSIPGVSGGTIAVITNIYEQLIKAISQINVQAVKLLLRGQFQLLWRHVNGSFLLTLALGILCGLVISANSVLYLLEYHFELLMGFFVGLVVASVAYLQVAVDWANWRHCAAGILGVCLAFFVAMLPAQTASIDYVTVFFSGMLAICAMILPGLSGAFILLILGVYEFILSALVGLQFDYILVFAAGCGIGLLSFTHLLAWLLDNYRGLAYGCISGMLLGSITVLWPWQMAGLDGGSQTFSMGNVSPLNYKEVTGAEPLLLLTCVSVFVGAFIVVVLHKAFNSSLGEK